MDTAYTVPRTGTVLRVHRTDVDHYHIRIAGRKDGIVHCFGGYPRCGDDCLPELQEQENSGLLDQSSLPHRVTLFNVKPYV